MAYVENFSFDIFISYAHLDNRTASDEEQGWIKQFYEDLSLALAQRIGRMDAITFWWDDKKLDGSILFDNSIEEGINRSAIMLSLVSPGYMESEYCKKEMQLFYNKAQNEPPGFKVGNRPRMLNLLLYNIPYKEWPKELSGTSGFPFYQAEDENDWGNPIDLNESSARKQLHDLREAIVTILKEMRQTVTAPPPPVEVPAFSIYFGDVADSLRTVRKRTITELEQQGYTIVCDVPPPYEKEEHEKAVKEKTEQAFLNVHLLDQFPGREIDGEETLWYPQTQVEIALRSEKPQLIWLPASTDVEVIEEEPYKAFMQQLVGGQTLSKKIDFIRGSKSELTQQIIGLMERLKKEQEQAVKTEVVAASNPAVLLDTHLSDQNYAWKLGSTLSEHGIQPYINPVDDNPTQNAKTWEERISQVNSMIFFFGKVSWDWVRARMNAALQAIVTNDYPVQEFVVFMVPPHKNPSDISLKQRILKLNVINNSDTTQLNLPTLEQFIQSIKKNRA